MAKHPTGQCVLQTAESASQRGQLTTRGTSQVTWLIQIKQKVLPNLDANGQVVHLPPRTPSARHLSEELSLAKAAAAGTAYNRHNWKMASPPPIQHLTWVGSQ